MTEQHFWKLIETSWTASPEVNELRVKALRTNNEKDLEELSIKLGDTILENYRQQLLLLDQENLTKYTHILEKNSTKLTAKKFTSTRMVRTTGFSIAGVLFSVWAKNITKW
jgi:hypothetical protein